MAGFENTFFELFNKVVRYIKIQPINLGGFAGSGGGSGGPPGGFIGYLPQTRVCYDESEIESLDIPSSGASLLDNLNHIRHRMGQLEITISGGIVVEEDNIVVGSGITIVNFLDNFDIENINNSEVTVSLLSTGDHSDATYSGVYGESLTSQIDGGNTHFTVTNEFDDESIAVFLNGIRQSPSYYIVDANHQGFITSFVPASGDTLLVDYAVVSYSGTFHTHHQYALSGVAYTKDQTDSLLANKSDTGHTHIESDITNLEHNAIKIQGVDVSATPPTNYQALVFNTIAGEYIPTDISTTSAIAIRYKTSSNQTLTKDANTYINFNEAEYDTHSAVTIGPDWHFTVPASGYYSINVTLYADFSTDWPDGSIYEISIEKNGVPADAYLLNKSISFGTVESIAMNTHGNDILYLDTGETIRVINGVYGTVGDKQLYGDNRYNHITIVRIGV